MVRCTLTEDARAACQSCSSGKPPPPNTCSCHALPSDRQPCRSVPRRGYLVIPQAAIHSGGQFRSSFPQPGGCGRRKLDRQSAVAAFGRLLIAAGRAAASLSIRYAPFVGVDCTSSFPKKPRRAAGNLSANRAFSSGRFPLPHRTDAGRSAPSRLRVVRLVSGPSESRGDAPRRNGDPDQTRASMGVRRTAPKQATDMAAVTWITYADSTRFGYRPIRNRQPRGDLHGTR